MATYTTGASLSRATRARAARVRAMIGQVAMLQAQAGMATSRGLTHGPQRGENPPSPVSPIRPIGRRSERLFRGWRVKRVASGRANERSVALRNNAPHHIFVLRPGGTKTMTDRGYWKAQREAAAPTLRRIAQRELHKALQG
jgi:hypothetical protein